MISGLGWCHALCGWGGHHTNQFEDLWSLFFWDNVNQIISAVELSNVFENVNNNKQFDKLRYGNKPARTKKNCRFFLLGYSVLLLRNVIKWNIFRLLWPLFQGKMRGIILGGAVVGGFFCISCHEWGVLFWRFLFLMPRI